MVSKERISPFDNIRILVVDDDEINQLVAKKLLSHLGCRVDVAYSGVEALALLSDTAQQKYDAVLMDILMPEMDGREATRQIRKMGEPYDNIPIIALSGADTDMDLELNLECGMTTQLKKPIELDQALSVLQEVLCMQDTSYSPEAMAEEKKNSLGKIAEIEIEGIDTVAGLSRVIGNLDLYEDLLESFAKNNRNIMQAVYQNFENSDHQKNEVLAHSIKGTSGTLGMIELFNYAEKIEQACRNKNINRTLLKGFEEILTIMVERIDHYIATAATRELDLTKKKSKDLDLFRKMVILLKQQLLDFDADAFTTLEKMKEEIEIPEVTAFMELEQLISNLDFKEAVEKLESYADFVLRR